MMYGLNPYHPLDRSIPSSGCDVTLAEPHKHNHCKAVAVGVILPTTRVGKVFRGWELAMRFAQHHSDLE